MSKSKVLLALSLVILGVLLAGIFLLPIAGGEPKYSVVQRESLLQTRNGWIIQFDIVNQEDQDKDYTVNLSVDGKQSTITVSIRARGVFTYIRHIYKDQVTKGEVSFTIYKGGEAPYVKKATYYLQ